MQRYSLKVKGDRIDCPLCDKSYQNNNRGRGHLKKHARKVHLPKEPVFVRRFKYWEAGEYSKGDILRYACPFPICIEKYITAEKLWSHFRRYDHFGLLFKKVKMKRRR